LRSHHQAPLSLLILVLAAPLAAQPGDRAAEAFHLGIGLLQRQLHQEAAEQFNRFLAAQPQHRLAAEAHYRLGCCQLELGDSTKGTKSFEAALAAGGDDFKLRPECRYRLGMARRERKEHQPAIEQLTALVSENGEEHYLRPAALFAIGECWRDLGQDRPALAAFVDAAQSERAGGEFGLPARYQAGFVMLRLQMYREAAAAFGEAADRYPDHAAYGECRFLQGDALFRAGAHAAAAAAFTQSRDAGGDFVDDALMGLAWCALHDGDREGGLALFRGVADQHASSPHAHKARLESGRLLHELGKDEEAARVLDGLLAEGSLAEDLRAQAQELSGLAVLAAGDGERAVERLRSALGTSKDAAAKARLNANLGAALSDRGDHAGAEQAYAEALAQVGDDASLRGDCLYGRCLALHHLGQFEESLALAEALRELDHPLRTHGAFAVAENLFARKKWPEALPAYVKLRDVEPFRQRARFKEAWCTYLLGDRFADAARLFEAISAEGDNPFAEESLSMTALSWMDAGDADRALAAADRYRGRYPKGAFLARGERAASRALQARGDLRGAAERLAAAAAAEGSGEQVRADKLESAELAFKQGDFAGAASEYTPLSAGDDRVAARALEGLAWCAFELGDQQACLQRIAQALAHPQVADRKPGLIELECAARQRLEQWTEAEEAAQRFLNECKGHPRTPAMRYALGVAQARAGRLAAARATLAALSSEDAGDRPDRVYYELAWACRKLGDEPAALAAFGEVKARTQDAELLGEADLHLGEAKLAAGDAAAGRALLAGVGGKYRGRALYRLAFHQLDAKEHAAARETFGRIVAEEQSGMFRDDALFLTAECAYLGGDFAAAAPDFARALEALPRHERAPRALVHGGEAMVRVDQPDQAIAWLERYVQEAKEPADGEARGEAARAHLWLGRALCARGRREAGIDHFVRATELSEGEIAAEAQFRVGEARRALGDHNGAVDAFMKLSILYSQGEWVRRGLLETGRCYLELEQPAKAKRFFDELGERFPDSAEANEAKGLARGGR
jgi:TolA-binding protein